MPTLSGQPGETIVAQVCAGCHAAGLAGAPRIGDRAAWSSRVRAAGGANQLAQSAAQGKNAMPPRGGRPELNDRDLRAAIDVMLKRSGVPG